MSRISREDMLMSFCDAAAERSSCLRNQVGAIIAIDGRPVSVGYNGAAKGKPHCTPATCGPDKPCLNTVHAEANAIAWAARKGIATEGSWLYCTYSPCQKCAELILASGIKYLVFKKLYRDLTPLNYLHYEIGYHEQVRMYQWDNLGISRWNPDAP
jgi:dCMP deaminase